MPDEVQSLLEAEATLAEVQGELAVIPAESATYIAAYCRAFRADRQALAQAAAKDGVIVPGLLRALRADGSPHLTYLHFGATSQDITDTALMMRLKPVIADWRVNLVATLHGLGGMAAEYAALPMAARTYGQIAVPTSFGAVVASWGRPLLRWLGRLDSVVLQVSLSGAGGTSSALPMVAEVRAAWAAKLGLSDPKGDWHSERDCITILAQWMAGTCASLGKMAEDLLLMTQSGIDEVALAASGSSSSMPQKSNPIGPSKLAALARHAQGLAATVTSPVHHQQRDGVAWFTEWLALPPLVDTTTSALALAGELSASIVPKADMMAAGLALNNGTIFAEALSVALGRSIGEPLIASLCREAILTGKPLQTLVARDFPDLNPSGVFDAKAQLGQAPSEARAFAKACQTL